MDQLAGVIMKREHEEFLAYCEVLGIEAPVAAALSLQVAFRVGEGYGVAKAITALPDAKPENPRQ